MNCQAIQNRILALPDPRHIPDPLRDHVLACAACRAWAEQAARLEGLLERLPVPPAPADKKSDLIDDLTRDPFALPMPARQPFASPGVSFFQRNATLIGGLAAAVIVAVGAWVAFTGNGGTTVVLREPTPKHPLLHKLVKGDKELTTATMPTQKLDILASMADDISAEARGLARIANPEDFKDLAQWYDRVVKKGMMAQAERMVDAPLTVSAADRKAKFEALAAKLSATAAETQKIAAEVPQGAKPTLERIVNTAREGEKQLRKMAQ
jgi:hypothetical protein